MAEELSDFIEASGLLEYDPVAIDLIYKKNPIRLLRRLWQTLLPIGLFFPIQLQVKINLLVKVSAKVCAVDELDFFCRLSL